MSYRDAVPDYNPMIGTLPMGEGESWFTQGNFVIPQTRSIEALPKQPWDSYKPDSWLGFIAWRQQPLWAPPYVWDAPAEQANYSYFTPLQQQVQGNAHQIFGMKAPTKGIYTGTDEGSEP